MLGGFKPLAKMTPEQQFEYINNSYFYRGLVINTFVNLERTIDSHLADEFITNKSKRVKFYQIVLDRLTFEAKRTALKAILDRKAIAKGFVKTGGNSYPHGKLLEDIRHLQDKRNNFAHYTMMIPTEDKGYVIGIAEFRDKFKPMWFTSEDIQLLIDKIDLTIEDLNSYFK